MKPPITPPQSRSAAVDRAIILQYSVPNLRVTFGRAKRNVGAGADMRGPGAVPGLYATESAMNELADHLKIDPVKLRIMNEPKIDEGLGLPFSSRHLVECFQLGAEEFGWSPRTPAVGSMKRDGLTLGWGTAGAYTNMAQLASQRTGVPLAKIEVALGDTSLPEGPLSGGSMASASLVPGVDVLQERGFRHEDAYLHRLRASGYEVLAPDNGLSNGSRIERTIHGMRGGVGAIAQAYLQSGRWRGIADVLLRVDRPSALGNWSYEVVDTKLARETKGGTILQLCLYSELLGQLQGIVPDRMHVVSPGCGFQPETFRLHDYLAYYRFVKSRLGRVVDATDTLQTYPDPVEQCDICQWWQVCNDRRRADDHLSFVAGIQKLQITELRNREVGTLALLAGMPLPLTFRPDRGSPETYEKVREQARLQYEYRTTCRPVYESLPLEPERGLAKLPGPSAGDIFLDFEADPFVEDGGLEYLLGLITVTDASKSEYKSTWAFDRSNERHLFESFIDFVIDRLGRYPDLHIYHFSQYEPTALKRLMGRYATREDEMGVFVDLHGVLSSRSAQASNCIP